MYLYTVLHAVYPVIILKQIGHDGSEVIYIYVCIIISYNEIKSCHLHTYICIVFSIIFLNHIILNTSIYDYYVKFHSIVLYLQIIAL